ncbi:hypothetical protein [Rhodoferax antarcticus]|uniref:Uncharacterized protein n=1 Tax=Rhodoferax antarcticus ANT.BR TaxID=1111071 RepID=A0A1Q8YJB2_9BURK|nr:hypothetical protein [Rhodoferax antarcticus]MCW2313763.1 hypothetical protein [Rhodoferax antarcticus]OLP08161.1 hypothetical protein BLL52_0449 [Rhodoferax antarcticus ANT.BR]
MEDVAEQRLAGDLAVWLIMDLWHAPALRRRLLVGWLMVITSLILLAYWFGLG